MRGSASRVFAKLSSAPLTQLAIDPRRARSSPRFAIFLVSTSVVVVLWFGAQRRAGRADDAGPTRPIHSLRGVCRGCARLAVGNRRRNRRRRPARPSGCSKFWPSSPQSARRQHPSSLPSPPRGEVAFDNVHFSYPTRAGVSGARRRFVCGAPGRKGRHRRPVRRWQEHDFSSAAALLRSASGPGHARRHAA